MTDDVRAVAAHVLTGAPDALRDAQTQQRFDAETYSWMKHGDLDAVERLGTQLAGTLIDECPWLTGDPAALVLPVAYRAVPPSCYFLARIVLRDLNHARREAGAVEGRIVKVHKGSVTHTDYATATRDERRAELARIDFRLDEPIDGCTAVVVDDVRVTGQAETAILGALRPGHPGAIITAYVAVCDAALAASPHVESALNHARVTSVLDLLPAIRARRFALTIRFLKRALGSHELAELVAASPPSLVRQMYDGAVSSGDELVTAYRDGVGLLERAVGRRRSVEPADA